MNVSRITGLSGRHNIALAYTYHRWVQERPVFTLRDFRDDLEEYALPGVMFNTDGAAFSRIFTKLLERGDICRDEPEKVGHWGTPPHEYMASEQTDETLLATLAYRLGKERVDRVTDGTFAARNLGMTVVVNSICDNLEGLDENLRGLIADSIGED